MDTEKLLTPINEVIKKVQDPVILFGMIIANNGANDVLAQ